MEIEALCGMGGEARMTEQTWRANPPEEIEYILTSVPDNAKVREAICKPKRCRLANVCTKKVHIVKSEDNGFSKATVRDIRFSIKAIYMTDIFAKSEEDLS